MKGLCLTFLCADGVGEMGWRDWRDWRTVAYHGIVICVTCVIFLVVGVLLFWLLLQIAPAILCDGVGRFIEIAWCGG